MTVLSIQDVSLRFPSIAKPTLCDINYDIHHGDFIILLGNNGSGKSSLLKLLYRAYQPDTGNIHFLGTPIASHQPRAFAKKVAVLTQNCNEALFTNLTIYENYLLAKTHNPFTFRHTTTEKKFLRNYLQDFNENLRDKCDVVINKLSGGEKQALALALCLLHPPALLLLDEHTSALDPKTSAQIMDITYSMTKKHSITCILTTHDLKIAMDYGNRILLLQNGKIRKTYNQNEKSKLTHDVLLRQYYDNN